MQLPGIYLPKVFKGKCGAEICLLITCTPRKMINKILGHAWPKKLKMD